MKKLFLIGSLLFAAAMLSGCSTLAGLASMGKYGFAQSEADKNTAYANPGAGRH